MNDGGERARLSDVGNVAEEAAKLLSALQGWVRESGADPAAAAVHAAASVAESLNDAGEHVGHGPDCALCPLCRTVAGVRATSPEVRQHLAAAASSLLQAVNGLLASDLPQTQESAQTGFEVIDLDETAWSDE